MTPLAAPVLLASLGASVASSLVATTPAARAVEDGDLRVRVTASAVDVDLGAAFGLTVERAWPTDLEPEPWREDALAPLELRLEGTERRELDGRVEEVHRYRAYAFTPGEVEIPIVWLRARDAAGAPRIAASDGLRLNVRSALGAGAPDEAELPGPPFPAPRRVAGPLALALFAAALLLWAGRSWTLRRAAARIPAPPEPAEVALARLERLRRASPEGPEGVRATCVEAAAVVRRYLDDGLGVRAPERTTEELLGDTHTAAVLTPPQCSALGECLALCDAVKFARHPPTAPERRRLLDGLEELVRATRTGANGGAA